MDGKQNALHIKAWPQRRSDFGHTYQLYTELRLCYAHLHAEILRCRCSISCPPFRGEFNSFSESHRGGGSRTIGSENRDLVAAYPVVIRTY
eukprot:3921316-Rhodomonas_salina.3